MNFTLSNSYQYDRQMNGYYEQRKKQFSANPESLFSMALYDVDAMASSEPSFHHATPAFYPVDEYKDLSLKEILDISDDLLISDDDPLMTAPLYDTAPQPTPLPSLSTPISPPSAALSDASQKKRSLDSLGEDEFDEDDDDDERRFRPYQAGRWTEKFAELCDYRKEMGHCLVPHTYKENLPLARWVKRQRYQYKLMMEGKCSTMTEERVKALEEIGFVWDSQGAAWEERLGELEEFRRTFMHCNVPSNYAQNRPLATWVKCQRRQYKLFAEGKQSNMTPKRIAQLENMGFEWELRSYKKARTC